MKYQSYVILCEDTIGELVTSVNHALGTGHQPIGAPFTTSLGKWCQAVGKMEFI